MELKEITVGTLVKFPFTHPVYKPADGWTLKLYFRGATALDITATTQDAYTFLVTLTVAQSGTLTSGQYFFQAYVSKGSGASEETHMVDSGAIRVLPNLSAAAAGFDGRSPARKTLDAIEAVLAKRATTDQQSYTIGQRTLTRIPLDQLLVFREKYARIVAQENRRLRRAKGLPFFESIGTEFRNAK